MSIDLLAQAGIAPQQTDTGGVDLLAQAGISPESKPTQQKTGGFSNNPIVNAIVAAGEVAPNALANELKKHGYKGDLYGDLQLAPNNRTSTKIGKAIGGLADIGVASAAAPEMLGAVAPELAGGLDAVSARIPLASKLGVAEGMIPRAAAMAGISAMAAPKGDDLKQAALGALVSPLGDIGGAYAGKAIKSAIGFPKAAIKKIMTGSLSPFHRAMAPIFHDDLDAISNELSHGVSPSDTSIKAFDNDRQHYKELLGNVDKEDMKYVKPGNSVGDMYDEAKKLGSNEPLDTSSFNDFITEEKSKLLKKLPITGKRLSAADMLLVDAGKKLPISPGDNDQAQNIIKNINKLSDFSTYAKNAPTLKDGVTVKEFLSDEQGKAWDSKDKTLSQLSSGAKDALRESFKQSASKSDFAKQLLDADAKYSKVKNMFERVGKSKSPFMSNYESNRGISEPNVKNYLEGYIKPNAKKDDWQSIRNFMNISPDAETKDLKAYHFIKMAKDNPKAFIKAYSKFGEGQRRELFPRHHELLNQYVGLAEKYPSLFPDKRVESSFLRKAVMGGLSGGSMLAAGLGHPWVAAAEATPVLAEGIAKMISKAPMMKKIYKTAVLSELTKKDANLTSKHLMRVMANIIRTEYVNKEK